MEMPETINSVGSFWETLDGFGPPPRVREIAAADLPGPYRRLLAHARHMTLVLEERCGAPVAARVLARRIDGNVYHRRTLLTRTDTGTPVLAGAVRLELDGVPVAARWDILEERAPLGRILLARGAVTEVEPVAYLEVAPARQLRALLAAPPRRPLYGRLARIRCDGRPAIDLLEIVAPA